MPEPGNRKEPWMDNLDESDEEPSSRSPETPARPRSAFARGPILPGKRQRSPGEEAQRVFANRSPILDASKRICAYQLDFIETVKMFDGVRVREPEPMALAKFLDATDPNSITSGRISFARIDMKGLCSFIDHPIWKGKIIPELDSAALEGESAGELLKILEKGKFKFCLDNLVFVETMRPLLSPDCFARIDTTVAEEADLSAVMWSLKSFLVTTLAFSVDTREMFELCCRAGFDLFHGEFFRKPSILTKNSISPNHALLLSLSAHAAREADISVVEGIFKKNPDLTFGLFNLVRSAFFHVSADVTSIRQAIAMLGYKNIQKWASLMLFTINHSDPSSNPLFENALVRARTMEMAAENLQKKGLSDAAYMTGIFSLVPALFDIGMEEIVVKASFGEEIREALLEQKGSLGLMLQIVAGLEKGKYDECNETARELGIGLDRILSAQTTAIAESAPTPERRNKQETWRAPGDPTAAGTGRPVSPRPAGSAPGKASWLQRIHAFFARP
ncbi:MAG: HDOD domain-containing protein [Syntrophorhabdales bacterium]